MEYLGAAEPMRCSGCGDTYLSAARCAAGHFVCDACHSGGAKDVIESSCRETAIRDPIEIALGLMRHPKLAMHGPEHHYLVPAALLAAYHNERGDPAAKAAQLAEARRRSDPIAGGFCGSHGACGAAIGTGVFVSLVTGATPLSVESWALANRMTAASLDILARVGGPRCCKRDTWLAILAASRFAREHLGVALRTHGPTCEFERLNRECLRERCPFHRSHVGATARV